MNKERQRALISDLIQLAKADGTIRSSEYDFILRVSERFDLTREDIDDLIENPVPSLHILTELERITHFHKLLLLMNVDWEAHEAELEMLKNFGLKLGIRPAAIDRILQLSEHYDHKIVPSEEIIKIFNTYYN